MTASRLGISMVLIGWCWASAPVAAQDRAKSDSKAPAAGKSDAAKLPKLESVEEYINRARDLREKHQYAQAKRDLDEAVRLDPASVPALVGRAWTLFFMRHGKEALADCNAALKLDPQSAEAYRARSNVDYLLNRYDLELTDMQEYIRLQPDDGGAYNHLGAALSRNNQPDKSIEAYSKAIELDPSQALFFENRAMMLVDRGRWDEALPDYNQMVRLEPSNPARYRIRGSAYLDKKKADETDFQHAIADFSEAIRLKPSEADAAEFFSLRGKAYYKLKDYGRAIADFDQAVKLDPKNALALDRRGLTYEALKNYPRAVTDYGEATKLSPKNTIFLGNRARVYDVQKDYELAIADYSTSIRLEPKTAWLYLFRGNDFTYLKKYAEAIADYTEVIRLDPNYSLAYEGRGHVYRYLHQWDPSQADYEKCLELRKAIYEKSVNLQREDREQRHADIATSLTDLAALMDEKGELEASQAYYEQALAINQEALGAEHPFTAKSLSNLGMELYGRGDYAAAKPKLEQALEIDKKTLGMKHAQTARVLFNLACLYGAMGDPIAARSCIEQSLAIRKEVLGPDHVETANALDVLGNSLRGSGDYSAASACYEQALAIRKKIPGTFRTDSTANILSDLGALSQAMGTYTVARDDFEQSLDIRKEIHGSKHPATIIALGKLGNLLVQMKQYKKARSELEQALALDKEVLGLKHPSTAGALASLGNLFVQMEDYAQARQYYEQALEVQREVLGPKNPAIAGSLSALALILRETGDLAKARDDYEQALAIRREVLGPTHPQVASSLTNLAILGAQTGDWKMAETNFDEARHIVRSHVARVLPGFSPKEQTSFLAENDEKPFHDALSLGLERRSGDIEVTELSYGWLLNGKAVVQEAIAQQTVLARQSNDPETINAVKELQNIRSQLATLSYIVEKADGEDARRIQVEQLESREAELARRLADVPGLSGPSNPWVETSAVRGAVPADAVLLDMARFEIRNFTAHEKQEHYGPAHYAAWLVPATDRGEVKIVDLGPAEKIDTTVQAVRTALEQSIKEMRNSAAQNKPFDNTGQEKLLKTPLADLAQLVLEPVLKVIPRDTKQLIISPDSNLWLVPWAALPLKDGRYAVEQFQIRYLVSGRDLANQSLASKLKPTTPIVFADPNYNLDSPENKLANGTTADAGQDGKHSNDKTRNIESTGSASALPKVGRLPGTATEAAAIKASLASYAHGQPIVYTDNRALESAFKSLRRPRVVVLATHGFFLPDQKPKAQGHDVPGESPAGERSVPVLVDADGKPIENPFLRCGLLLAGCNSRTKTQSANGDDGILTGMEIIGTDLRGTELVVLSACETGLGQIHNGEGVAGLRQAFQLAGAQSVVATLWQIPDTDSSAIMSTFFEKLAGGDSKVESLRQAQLARIATLRQRFAAAPPVFWAAFTVTGR